MLLIDSPSLWLKKFLQDRNLPSPNGNPLFSYQMTQDEYRQLGEIVKQFHPKTNISWNKHEEWAACFVIFCAEWYRRDCSAQKWEWSPLWAYLGFELNTSRRAESIPLGLETYWLRPIRRYESDNRNFLGSIFIEGGLPFKLISSPGNSFSEAIRKILKLYYQVDLYSVVLTELVEKHLSHLPVVFSEPESVELIASVVKNLMSCANQVDIENSDEAPSKQLDKRLPGWRDSFPIPLDDDTGTGLLDNWLLGATNASTDIKRHKDKLACVHYFDIYNGRFYTQISLPKKLIFSPKNTTLQSCYVELGLLEGTRRIADFGGTIAQIENQKIQVPPRRKTVKIPRTRLHSSLFADLSQSGIIIDKVEVDDSSISLNEAPLGFIEENEKYRVIGQGSFSTKFEEVFVLAPLLYEIESLSGEQELLSQPTIDGTEYNWLRVNGDFRFYNEGNRFRVRTNATSTSSGGLFIDGDEMLYKTTPARVYRGLPLVRDSEGTLASQLGLSIYLDNQPVDSLASHELYGKHYLSVKNKDNETLLRKLIAVLPNDLSIDTSVVNGCAEVKVTASQNQFIEVDAEGCDVESEKLTKGRIFRLKSEGEPPSSLNMHIQANLMEDPIAVTLPFPARGIYAFNSEGQKLKTDLTVEQLLGAEANLYSTKEYPEEVSIELVLKPTYRSSPRYLSKVMVNKRTSSVSLYSFKEKIIELMSVSNELDAEVEIIIEGLGAKKEFSVRRYKSQLNFDPLNGSMSIAQSELSADDKSISPMVMLIAEPERPAIELPEKEFGGISLGWYSTTEKMDKSGPWMIVPNPTVSNLFRPAFYQGLEQPDLEVEEIKSIQTAVKCLNPRANVNSIATFLKQMEGDFTHPGWNYYIKLWENYSYLPLSTYEAWKALVNNVQILPLALFKFEMNEEFLRALDTEFAILWELIPVEAWLNSIHTFKSTLLQLGLPTSMVDERLETLIEKFSSVIINVPEALLDLLKGKPLPPQLPYAFIEVWKQELIREHSESDWPVGLNHIFEQDIAEIAELKRLIEYPHYRQCSVAIYPVAAAAIAAGVLDKNKILSLSNDKVFEIKQVKSFEPSWFSSVYSFALSYYLQK